MFTGIVEQLGSVQRREGERMTIVAPGLLDDVELGASIAVNGCCLTVVSWDAEAETFDVDVTQETYDRTQLGELEAGAPVNLERPVRLADRLGGHLVQGHVDAVGVVVRPAPDLKILVAQPLHRYLVEKGSVTVDGVSLTVVDPASDGFTVAVIPHTMEVTTLGVRQPGDKVNIEVDVMAKYAERLLTAHLGDADQEMRDALRYISDEASAEEE